MAINLSIVEIANTPSAGAAQTWVEFPGDGVPWFNPRTIDLGASQVVIAYGDETESFNDLLVRTQQVEAALSNPAAGIGQSWPGVMVLDADDVVPFNLLGDSVRRFKRLVPSLFGPAAPNARLKVYWST